MHLWSSSFHTITGISIAGNIYRVISKWTAHYPIRPASLDTNAQTKTVYGSSPIVVCSWDTSTTSSTKVPTAQTWSSQGRCIKSTTIELTTFNPQGLYIVCFPVMSSTLRQLCATISVQYHMYQQYNAYKYVHRNKKTIVNIVKSSVKHNKTYWSKLWFRSDTHLILLWY